MLREVRQPDRVRFADEEAEDAVPFGFVADAGPGLVVDADRHELDEVAHRPAR